MRLNLIVPGNILLLGEYAVLEEGGLGITMAVDRYIHVSGREHEEPAVYGHWPGGELRWSLSKGKNPLLDAVSEELSSYLEKLPDLHLDIDSSSFYTSDGEKLGFGSSAAATVGACGIFLEAAGIALEGKQELIGKLALQAHRKANKGRGSGYDIYTSTYGGIGLFTGGREAQLRKIPLDWLPDAYILRGERSVLSAEAVEKYLQWKREKPDRARDFLRESNRIVCKFLSASSWTEALPWFRRAKELGLKLGEEINEKANIAMPYELETDEECKALGAGGELGVLFSPRKYEHPDLEALGFSEKGVSATRT